MKRHVPLLLTTLRLLLGPVALACALAGAAPYILMAILIAGTLSDIFDGIIARHIGVATTALRRYDSLTDIIFYLFILAAVWILRKPLILATWRAIALLLVSEAAVILVSYSRFRRYPAAHSYLAKFYGLCLPAALIGMLGLGASKWPIVALAAVAVVTNGESIAIHFLSDEPPVDVRSVFLLLRSDKEEAAL